MESVNRCDFLPGETDDCKRNGASCCKPFRQMLFIDVRVILSINVNPRVALIWMKSDSNRKR